MFKPALLLIAGIMLLTSAEANACMLPYVKFAVGSTRLPAEGQDDVNSILQEALADPQSKVKLTALTNYSPENRRMAERRVKVIRAVLMKGGVSANRIRAKYEYAGGENARVVGMDVVSTPTCG